MAGIDILEPILAFTCRYPTIITGKAKGRLATNNSANVWFRYQKTKIKNDFKSELGQWTIPKSILNHSKGSIRYTILRPNNKRIDADSLALSAGKWTADYLVEQGWFIDDNDIQFIYMPMVHDESYDETMIKVEVYSEHIV